VLGVKPCGRPLPRDAASAKGGARKLDQLKRHGKVDFDMPASNEKAKASIGTLKKSRYLNAEDDTT